MSATPARRVRGRGAARLAALAALIGAGGLAAAAPADSPGEPFPWPQRIAAAKQFAERRAGTVSFAVVDEQGKLRGRHVSRVHNSASVVKVMFMVALLREPEVRDDALSGAERALLKPMIRRSDNQAATAIYRRVGEGALYDLARDAGMKHFTTQPLWGLSTITAKEQARFFFRLERFIPKRHRGYAMRLLARIVPSQRWGIAPVAPQGWKLHFKGGWSGRPNWRINQVMLLRRPPRRFSVAILSKHQPAKEYGQQTIEGVAKRLLRGYR